MSKLNESALRSRKSDALRLDATIDVICGALQKSKPDAPSTYAIYGPWGCGKTSLLNFVHAEIRDKVNWIEFDAWSFHSHGNIVLALLHRLQAAAKAANDPQITKLIASVGLTLVFRATDALFKKAGFEFNVDDVAKDLERLDKLRLPESPSVAMREAFESLVAAIVKRTNKRVILAIDNLDRCTPEAALSFLESLYLVMTAEIDMTIVIAVDQGVLIDFITKKYRGTRLNGTKFLEKLFPDYVRVPDPWVRYRDTVGSKDEDDIYRFINRHIDECPRWLQRRKDDLWLWFSQPLALRNPRRIKRILRRLKLLGSADCEGEEFEHVFIIVVLSDLWPDVMEFFQSSDERLWQAMIDYVCGKGGALPERCVPVFEDRELCDFIAVMATDEKDNYDSKRAIHGYEDLWNSIHIANEVGV